jgi:glycosyltransferase involved in cell wall biosynthesis
LTPQVAIGMPVFNDVDFIESSLNSILNQSFQDFILIISDDGSTDGSGAICKAYATRYQKIVYTRQSKNLGISRNMKYLLGQAKTPYFMWAGDDDIMDKKFIESLMHKLEASPDMIGAFCTYRRIDDKGEPLTPPLNFDYSGNSAFIRLKNFIKDADDIWGYGLFKTDQIKGVRFPIWWWPNRSQSYNNIFPSLCYYLARGNYGFVSGDVLFMKRDKSLNKMNHSDTLRNSGLRITLNYIIRRFYLCIFSALEISRSRNVILSFRIFPFLLHYWFILSSIGQIKLVWNAQMEKLSS